MLEKCHSEGNGNLLLFWEDLLFLFAGAFEEFHSLFLGWPCCCANNINMDKYCNLPGMVMLRDRFHLFFR